MYKLSVIIPVYNVENYIKECLDSIINQTIGIENIEVIIINDCSTDNTENIIKQYTEKYPSIKLINQKTNQGPGEARNIGIKKSTGEYITFLDGDDFISTNTYKHCIDQTQKNPDADLIIYKYTLYTPKNINIPPDIHQEIYKKDQTITNPNKTPEIIFSTSPWNKIYKRKLIPYLQFPNMLYEDNITSVKTILNSEKTIITTQPTYYYRYEKENTSRSQKITTKNINDLIKSIKQILNLKTEYKQYTKLLEYLSIKFTYDILFWIQNLNINYEQLKNIIQNLKETTKNIQETTINEFEEKFPIYKLTNKKALKDLQKIDTNEYLIKYKYEKIINPEYQATVYIETPQNKEIKEIQKTYKLNTTKETIELEYNLPENNLKKIRFDPIENKLCTCTILETTPPLKITNNNAQNPSDKTQMFLTKDPQYTLEGNLKNTNTIKIKFKININSYQDMKNYYENKIKKLNKEIEKQEFDLKAKDKIINNKNEIIEKRDQTIKEITESTSWKITKPIRKIKK